MPKISIKLESIKCLKTNDDFLNGDTDELHWGVKGGGPLGMIDEFLPFDLKFEVDREIGYNKLADVIETYKKTKQTYEVKRYESLLKYFILWSGDLPENSMVWLNVSFIESDWSLPGKLLGLWKNLAWGGIDKLLAEKDKFTGLPEDEHQLQEQLKAVDKTLTTAGTIIRKSFERSENDLIGMWGVRVYCNKQGNISCKWSAISRSSLVGEETSLKVGFDMRGGDSKYKVRLSVE